MEDQARVSVVIVNFNTRDLLLKCVESVIDQDEVIIVDNASSDGSVDAVRLQFPSVQIISNNTNVGFGSANNQGIVAARNSLILLLNSDAEAQPGAVRILSDVFLDSKVVAAGGRLLNRDGTMQNSSANQLTLWCVFCEQFGVRYLLPAWLAYDPYWNSSKLDKLGQVAQVMGACLMMRKGLEKFDERFFLYCEDTELCHRLQRHGQILYVPKAKFFHELGSSSKSDRWRSVALYNRGKELYFEIHHGNAARWKCFILNRCGALGRLLVWSLMTLLSLGATRRRVSLFARVLTAPIEGPPIPSRTAPESAP